MGRAELRVLWLPAAFLSYAAWLYYLTSVAPTIHGDDSNATLALKFPTSADELESLGTLLGRYYEEYPNYINLLFASAYVFKQTFAIPGSFFLNVLAGHLFGVFNGFIIVSVLTTMGATCCYSIANLCGKAVIRKYFSNKIAFLEKKIEENKDDLFYFLLFLRVFPVTPNWFINMASPVIGVPIHLFSLTICIGLMPYNFLCCQAGALIRGIRSPSDVFTTSVAIRLALLSLAALVPAILKRYSQRRIRERNNLLPSKIE